MFLFQMPTIDDIEFNRFIYEHATDWTLILYEINGISVVIDIPDANLMSFIQTFNDSIECQELVLRNPRKIITLFVYEKNIQQWLANDNNISDNLQNIKLFCHSDDRLYITEWANRYKNRFNNIIFDIINFEHLNFNLLSFGLEYIKRLRREFQNENGILNILDEDYKRICQSLGNYALQRANIEDERIRQSREAQS